MSQSEDQCEPDYRTSSYSGGGGCVAVKLATPDDAVRVRHSRHPEEGTLVFTASEWRAFIDGVKAGEFDLI